MISVEKFISNFKKGFDEKYLEEVFTNGNCYHFALILKSMYGGKILYDPHMSHFLIKIDGKYYDITGVIKEPLDTYNWEELKNFDREEYEMVKATCVYKL